MHAIKVAGIPETAPVNEAAERLRVIFEKMFSKEKVVGARVLPKFDDLYDKALKLKTYRKRLEFYKHKNEENSEG